MFANRTAWNLATNRYTTALEMHRRDGREVFDLTASNPTTVGFRYNEDALLQSLTRRDALIYQPEAKGLLVAREAVASYYAEREVSVSARDLILTTSTSEAYSFIFRLLCNPGDAVLVPSPSYPLFDFLADLQDVRLVSYELIYDHGWQIDFHSLRSAMDKARGQGLACRAVLVVHPNNPTGSYVKPHEAAELQQMCARDEMAIIADEVFLDYPLMPNFKPITFAGDHGPAPAAREEGNKAALTFTLSGLSKISGLPQMKVAWLAVNGPGALKSDALDRLEVIADTYLSMNAPIQWAIPILLEERHNIQPQMSARILENLEQLDFQLSRQMLCHRLEVEGGWYAILRVPITGADEEFAISLLEHQNVLVHPGHFYDFASEGHMILSLITPEDELAEGVSRLLRFVAEH